MYNAILKIIYNDTYDYTKIKVTTLHTAWKCKVVYMWFYKNVPEFLQWVFYYTNAFHEL